MRLPWWWGKRGWEAYIRSRIKPCGNINKTGYDILVSIDEDGKMKSELPSYVFSSETRQALRSTGEPVLLSGFIPPFYHRLVYNNRYINVLTKNTFNNHWKWLQYIVECIEILVKEATSSCSSSSIKKKEEEKKEEKKDLCEATKIWLYVDKNGNIVKSILPKWIFSADLIEKLKESGIPILTNNSGTKLFYMGYSIGPISERWSSDAIMRYTLILGQARTLIKKAKREVTS
ncbi:MAG: hypothetical protein DRJ64_00670 [Thermoprotei archaeon]|nr:MAG: hypothetical protein DRJ64_00670 [Thermoprotei archaeon]